MSKYLSKLEQLRQQQNPELGRGLPNTLQPKVKPTHIVVKLQGLSVSTGNYQEVGVDGNDTDLEKPVQTGLIRCDDYLHTYDEGTDTWNRQRGNYNEAVVESAARTATYNTAVMDNFNSRGGHFLINVTNVGAGVTLIPSIYAFDPVTALSYPLLNDPAAPGLTILAAGQFVQKIYPGIGALPGLATSDILPRFFLFRMTHGGAAGSATYSVSFNQVV